MLVESKACCHVADASLSRLELIWPLTKNVQEDMCFWQKALEVNRLFQKKYTPSHRGTGVKDSGNPGGLNLKKSSAGVISTDSSCDLNI